MKTAVTAPQAINKYRTGPVSVDSIVSMETSRWIRSACLPRGWKGQTWGGNSLFLAEYSTKDLSFNCFAFEKQGSYILLMFQVLDGIHGGQEAVTWRMGTEWR